MTRKKPCLAGQRARQACIDMPDASTRTLADYLLRKYPKTYRSYEHARGHVRYYRGESGVHNRSRATPQIATTKFVAPLSDAHAPAPYEMTIQGKGMLISDVHVPYHDQVAFEMAVNHAISAGCTDYLIILGDFIDHYQLSRYAHDPEARNFAGEIEIARGILKDLAGVFGKIIYKAGNHERRYIDYMRLRAPALIGVPQFTFPRVLGLEDISADFVAWNSVIHVGDKLTLLHGHEFGGSVFSPVNPARGLFLRSKACAICGHHHQTSQHDEPNVRGTALTTWSLGCLCDLHPEYMPFNRWNHGFAEFAFGGGNEWQIENRRIVHGKVR